MTTHHINLVASRHPDWIDMWHNTKDTQLRINTTRHGRYAHFSILIQGPHGAARRDMGGPLIPGPWGCFISEATIITNHPHPHPPTIIDAAVGDTLIMTITRDWDYTDGSDSPVGTIFTATIASPAPHASPTLELTN